MTHNFASFSDRIDLAARGIFSVDTPEHRALRAAQAARRDLIASAYAALGWDRKAIYRDVAQRVAETENLGGVWVTSSGAYAAGVAEADESALRHYEILVYLERNAA